MRTVRLPCEQRQPGGVRVLEALLGDGEEEGVVAFGGRKPEPGAVGAVDEGAAGAQADDVLAEQGAEHAGEEYGFDGVGGRDGGGHGSVGHGGVVGSDGSDGGHGWISQRRAARKSATTRSTVSWPVPVARSTPR